MSLPRAHSLDDSATGPSVAELYIQKPLEPSLWGALLRGPQAEKLREKGPW